MNDETRSAITTQVTKVLALMGEEVEAFKKIPEPDTTLGLQGQLGDGDDYEPAEASPEVQAYQQCMTRRCDAELDLIMLLRKIGGVDAN